MSQLSSTLTVPQSQYWFWLYFGQYQPVVSRTLDVQFCRQQYCDFSYIPHASQTRHKLVLGKQKEEKKIFFRVGPERWPMEQGRRLLFNRLAFPCLLGQKVLFTLSAMGTDTDNGLSPAAGHLREKGEKWQPGQHLHASILVQKISFPA